MPESSSTSDWWSAHGPAVGEFLHEEVALRANMFDIERHLPADVVSSAAKLGLFGLVVPRAYGGLEQSMATLGTVHEAAGRACSSLRSVMTVSTMVTWAINRWGDSSQRDRWLPAMATGSTLAGFALTEAAGGSDAGNIQTSAVRTAAGWRLAGRKEWVTAGQIADLFLVFASTPAGGIAAFLVPSTTPGLRVEPAADALGLRAGMHATLVMEAAEVGPDALLGPAGMGHATVMTGALDIGRYSVAAGCVGILQACVAASSAYARRRQSGGGVLHDNQLIKRLLANMVTATRAAQALRIQAGALKDAGVPETIMATMIAKYFASTAAVEAARDAVQIHGANGCTAQYPVERLYRDAKIMEIIEGSSEIQQLAIADEASREGASVYGA